MTWAELPSSARAFRLAHLVWGAASMASLGHVWLSALRRRRTRLLVGSMAFLSVEGVALVVGRGDCPFGPFQARLGDPVPMFELLLPPRAAKAAVPILTIVTLAGFAAVLLRSPATAHREPATAHREPATAHRRLATYGSLAPGRPNHHEVAALRGLWRAGSVRGRLVAAGWGSGLGYPGLLLDQAGDRIDVQVLESDDLPDHWARLDDFEGPGYRRVVASVLTAAGTIDASIYVLADDAGG